MWEFGVFSVLSFGLKPYSRLAQMDLLSAKFVYWDVVLRDAEIKVNALLEAQS
jgi:hypothetical protein